MRRTRRHRRYLCNLRRPEGRSRIRPVSYTHLRVGVFEYSPEEGTEAAELPDQIDDETKQNRRLIVEELQSGVLDDYNTSRHGEVMQVLCEGFDEEQGLWYGRTYADSVEVDGHVYFDAADNEPAEGEFVSVLITESLGPDLLGVRQKEA